MVIYADLLLGALLNCPVTNPIVLSRKVSIFPRADAALNHHLFLKNDKQPAGHGRETKAGDFEAGKHPKGEVVTLFCCWPAQQPEYKSPTSFTSLFDWF